MFFQGLDDLNFTNPNSPEMQFILVKFSQHCDLIHTYIRTYVRTYIHTYVRTYVHTHIYIYIHTCVYIYIYMRYVFVNMSYPE